MHTHKKKQICELLKSIETGDPKALSVVNESKYIQHNPQTFEGSEGLAVLFKKLAKTSPTVKILRAFEDGAFVFAHTEYHFSSQNVGFEIFRFENGQAVEHWDNIQKKQSPNRLGYIMTDGSTKITDVELTESNRSIVQRFVEEVLISKHLERFDCYIDAKKFIEHSPRLGEDSALLQKDIPNSVHADLNKAVYSKSHRILAEGNFVLSVCEGHIDQIHTSFFDLYRLENERIVEHWDTTEIIPPRNEWQNDNGKF